MAGGVPFVQAYQTPYLRGFNMQTRVNAQTLVLG